MRDDSKTPVSYFFAAWLPAAMITKIAKATNAHQATLSVSFCHLRMSHMRLNLASFDARPSHRGSESSASPSTAAATEGSPTAPTQVEPALRFRDIPAHRKARSAVHYY